MPSALASFLLRLLHFNDKREDVPQSCCTRCELSTPLPAHYCRACCAALRCADEDMFNAMENMQFSPHMPVEVRERGGSQGSFSPCRSVSYGLRANFAMPC